MTCPAAHLVWHIRSDLNRYQRTSCIDTTAIHSIYHSRPKYRSRNCFRDGCTATVLIRCVYNGSVYLCVSARVNIGHWLASVHGITEGNGTWDVADKPWFRRSFSSWLFRVRSGYDAPTPQRLNNRDPVLRHKAFIKRREAETNWLKNFRSMIVYWSATFVAPETSQLQYFALNLS